MQKYLLDDNCFTFSTQAIPEKERFDYWHEVVCRKIANVNCKKLNTGDQDFNGILRVKRQEDIQLAEVYADPIVLQQSKSTIGQLDNDSMLISLRLNSPLHKRHNNEVCSVTDGDISIYHCSREQTVHLDGKVESLMLQIPLEKMNYYFDHPADLNGITLSKNEPFGHVIPSYMMGLVHELGRLETLALDKVMNNFLHLLSLALNGKNQDKRIDCEALRSVQLKKILNFIRVNIENPELRPSYIAQKHNMSLRYLYNIFDQHQLTPSQFIQDERLNVIARQLASNRKVKISEVAVKYGFSNFSHFSRTFKKKYGQTPRDYKVEQYEKNTKQDDLCMA